MASEFTGTEPVIERREAYGGRMHVEVTQKIADAEAKAINNPALQKLDAYRDLPPVENANRKIVDGMVKVGPKGAPEITGYKYTNMEGMKRLEEMGLPKHSRAWQNIADSGDGGRMAELLPEGSKYLGQGVEGVGFRIGRSGDALRIQHGGGKPLDMPNMGKIGMYADWMKQYGSMYVEKKEMAVMQGEFLGRGITVNKTVRGQAIREAVKRNMDANMAKVHKGIHTQDDHGGNWGIDTKGRARAFDAGYARPAGDYKVAAIWE